jgi:hypothetical protein
MPRLPQEYPRQTWRPQCPRTAKRSGRLATASSACQTERDIQTAKPGKQARKTIAAGGNLHGDMQPAARRSALDYGMATALPR